MGEGVGVYINKIFLSVQGEGVYQGESTTFVRFQGCNLNPGCAWCDTDYARAPGHTIGTWMTIDEIMDEIVHKEPRTYKHWVCITGGEPLLQLDGLRELVNKVELYGMQVEVETNGTLPKPFWWTKIESWVADIKCPSSGVKEPFIFDDWTEMRAQDQVKLVVGTPEDVSYADQVLQRLSTRYVKKLVSPVITPEGRILMEDEAIRLCLKHKARFSLQVHKLVGAE